MAAFESKTNNSQRTKSRLSLKNQRKALSSDICPAPVPRSSHRIRTSSNESQEKRTNLSKKFNASTSQNTEDCSAFNGFTAGRIGGICPLANLGNTCFLNSVLYALRFLPGFMHDVHHLHKHLENSSTDETSSLTPRINFLNELHTVFHRLREEEKAFIDTRRIPALHPLHFLNSLRVVNPLFEGNRQQDAHELLHCLLDQLCNLPQDLIKVLNENEAKSPKVKRRKKTDCDNIDSFDVVGSKFMGRMKLETRCCECEQTNSREESFLEVCVPVKTKADFNDEDLTDTEILQTALCEEAPLIGSNKYWCETCCHHNEARRTVHYPQLPRHLLVHVKRFNSYSRTFASKCCDGMPAPLKLPCFCYKCHRPKESKPDIINVTHLPYYLTSFVCHLGATISSGHYISFVRISSSTVSSCGEKEWSLDSSQECSFLGCCSSQLERCISTITNGHFDLKDEKSVISPDGVWLECDDEKIKVVSLSDVIDVLKSNHLTPYLLFYSR